MRSIFWFFRFFEEGLYRRWFLSVSFKWQELISDFFYYFNLSFWILPVTYRFCICDRNGILFGKMSYNLYEVKLNLRNFFTQLNHRYYVFFINKSIFIEIQQFEDNLLDVFQWHINNPMNAFSFLNLRNKLHKWHMKVFSLCFNFNRSFTLTLISLYN